MSKNINYSKFPQYFSAYKFYRPELRKYFGRITNVILVDQIEHCYASNPNIFYKILSPYDQHHLYREGDSWG